MLNELAIISEDKERFDDHLTVFSQLVEMLKLFKQNPQQKTLLQNLFRETKQSGNWRKWSVVIRN